MHSHEMALTCKAVAEKNRDENLLARTVTENRERLGESFNSINLITRKIKSSWFSQFSREGIVCRTRIVHRIRLVL